jgi:hypothetical protein
MSNKSTEDLYHDFLAMINKSLDHHDPLAVASIMTTMALSIYRTALNEEDYEQIVSAIYDRRKNIYPFPENKGTLH